MAGGLVDAAGNAPHGCIQCGNMGHNHSTRAIYSEKFTSMFTAPMDLNIMCKYRYAVKLWIDG